MKHKLILFSLLFIAILSSCKKSSDVNPNVNIVGTWTCKSQTGTVTINGKSSTLPSSDFNFSLGNKCIFNSDGSGSSDLGSFAYNTSGSSLKIAYLSFGTIARYDVTVSGSTLILKPNEADNQAAIAFAKINGITLSFSDATVIYTK